ncbi:uncharacterized protein LOC132205040 isoform X2 [Neocloeon triangulifer]|uniref:uncharacterized protein LOC132205040 isoform X2 n=1 Tax=Neocloeon triangulifer TaxID=2078957 RepID=UPI00286EF3D4|nr:uncharacterized protein LOC132205040 isoform X2 [Neocloeon triangulifer]
MEHLLPRVAESTVCASATRRSTPRSFDKDASTQVKDTQSHLLYMACAEETPAPLMGIGNFHSAIKAPEELESQQPWLEGKAKCISTQSAPGKRNSNLPMKMTVSRAAKRKLQFPTSSSALGPADADDCLIKTLESIFNTDVPTDFSQSVSFDKKLPRTNSFSQQGAFPSSFKVAENKFFSDNSELYTQNSQLVEDDNNEDHSDFLTCSYSQLVEKYCPTNYGGNESESDSDLTASCSILSPLIATTPPKTHTGQDASVFSYNFQSLSQTSLLDDGLTMGEKSKSQDSAINMQAFKQKLLEMNAEEIMKVVKELQH